MKWVSLFITLAAIVPLAQWIRRNPQHTPKIWVLIGFLPFGTRPFHLFMAAVSWPDWAGYVKGFEFSILDALALAMCISLPGRQRVLPFRILMICYFLAVLLSALQAGSTEAALFYPWQLARMFVVYLAVSRGSTDPRVVAAILQGMGAGLCMEAGFAAWQRFALGELQTTGTVGHQNLLGIMSHLVVFPFFALLLSKRGGWYPVIVLLAGLITEVLTTSRATVGLAAFAYVALFSISALRRWTSRKAQILLIGAAAASLIAPLAVVSFEHRMSLEKRFDPNTSLEDYDERAAFIRAASMIFSDHPMGVGANQYVRAAFAGDYYRKGGVHYASWGIPVHNVYWLVSAETGYIGLVTFVPLLFYPVFVALRCGWRSRGDQRGDLLLGFGVALLTVYIHSFFEFGFLLFEIQYLYVLELGMIAGLAQQLGYWRLSQPVVRTAPVGPVRGSKASISASAIRTGFVRKPAFGPPDNAARG